MLPKRKWCVRDEQVKLKGMGINTPICPKGSCPLLFIHFHHLYILNTSTTPIYQRQHILTSKCRNYHAILYTSDREIGTSHLQRQLEGTRKASSTPLLWGKLFPKRRCWAKFTKQAYTQKTKSVKMGQWNHMARRQDYILYFWSYPSGIVHTHEKHL